MTLLLGSTTTSHIGTAALAGTVLGALILLWSRPRHDDRNKMPGPHNDVDKRRHHPLLGVLPDLVRMTQENRLQDFFKNMHDRYGRVVYAWSPVAEFLMIADAKEVSKHAFDSESFPRGTSFKDVAVGIFDSALFTMPSNDPRWKPHRRILSQGFSPSNLKTGFTVTLTNMDRLLALYDSRFTSTQPTIPVELGHAMTAITLDVIGHMIFGKDFATSIMDECTLIKDLRAMTDLAVKRAGIPRMFWWLAGVGLDKSDQLRTSVYAFLSPYVMEKQILRSETPQEPSRKDICDHLLDAVENGTMTMDELMSELLGLLFAGFDTTSYALTAAFYLLCTEPEALQKVLDEIEEVIGMDGIPTYADLKNFRYLESFFKETLRLHPSAITVPRVTGRPTQVSGHRIPSGVHTFFDVQALHTDKMYWGDDADVFRPDRWLEEGVEITEGAYIPFGVGPMKCIGMKLAHIESKIVLIRTLQRFHVSLKPNFTPVKAFYLACGFKTLEVELVRREC